MNKFNWFDVVAKNHSIFPQESCCSFSRVSGVKIVCTKRFLFKCLALFEEETSLSSRSMSFLILLKYEGFRKKTSQVNIRFFYARFQATTKPIKMRKNPTLVHKFKSLFILALASYKTKIKKTSPVV